MTSNSHNTSGPSKMTTFTAKSLFNNYKFTSF